MQIDDRCSYFSPLIFEAGSFHSLDLGLVIPMRVSARQAPGMLQSPPPSTGAAGTGWRMLRDPPPILGV